MSQLLIVKIGDSDRPAQAEDIQAAQQDLKELIGSKAKTNIWVTHHAVNVNVVPLGNDYRSMGRYGDDENEDDEIVEIKVLGMDVKE